MSGSYTPSAGTFLVRIYQESTEPTAIRQVASGQWDAVFVRFFEPREPLDTMSGDVTLTCRDCGQAFTFTSGEQDFYASRGFSEPTRCSDCRAARRADRDRGGYSSGYDSAAPRGPRQMYEAVCSGCGGIASVPFQPSADKPVYCSTCFEQRRGTGTGGRYAGRGRY